MEPVQKTCKLLPHSWCHETPPADLKKILGKHKQLCVTTSRQTPPNHLFACSHLYTQFASFTTWKHERHVIVWYETEMAACTPCEHYAYLLIQRFDPFQKWWTMWSHHYALSGKSLFQVSNNWHTTYSMLNKFVGHNITEMYLLVFAHSAQFLR